MSPSNRSTGNVWRRLGLAAGCFLLLAAGLLAWRGDRLKARAKELARSVYHQLKAAGSEAALAEPTAVERAERPLVIFADGLGDGWQDWSWAEHSLTTQSPVRRGKSAISMVPVGYKGVYLHHDAFSTAGYGTLELFVNGDSAVNVAVARPDNKFNTGVPIAKYLQPDPEGAKGWKLVRIPLVDLGLPKLGGPIAGIAFQAASDKAQSTVFFDEVTLQPDPSLPTAPTEATVAIDVDVNADRHPISPYIYGMAFAPKDYLADLRLGCNRWGGNSTTRYNWALGNATSAARDWRWANKPAIDAAVQSRPSSAADHFTDENRAAGAATLLTVPTIGWVARDSDNGNTSVNVPDHGGAPLTNAGGAIPGYDPAENRRRTSVRSEARKRGPFTETPAADSEVVYQDEWVNHLVKRFGNAERAGVRFYSMDNEPDLWDTTHTDIHPVRMGYDAMVDQFTEYASAVKAVDPTAEVTGPVAWGWPGFLYSALDRGDDNFHTHADRKAHGDEPFLPWFLKQVRSRDAKSGKRTLDVLDVHYYPQGQNVFSGALDPGTRAVRLRSTRSLWDPQYTDESWIAEPVRLIPRLKEWIADGYPGTKIGISEWNFGAEADMNGALAIADTLGIYGREGVYLANYWAYPPKGSPGYLAFKLFRNVDGQGHGLADVSCKAASQNGSQVSAFAAADSKTHEVTLLLVNKMPKATVTAPLTVTGLSGESTVRSWRLSADDPKALAALPAAKAVRGSLTLSLPPSSITLVAIGAGGAAR